MVYLTTEILKQARGFVNPCKKRELDLRGLSLDTLENLGLTFDQYDVIDISSNYIKRLEKFPSLQRLECIIAHNNCISSMDNEAIARVLPSLRTLLLTNNDISDINEVKSLQKCKTLQHLSLVGNPVTFIENYRMVVIASLPFLRTLDFQKVTRTEKEAASNVIDNSVVATRVNGSSDDTEVATKAPRSDNNNDSSNNESKPKKTIDKALLKQAIDKANTPEILAALERALKNGTFDQDFVNSMGGNKEKNDVQGNTQNIDDVEMETKNNVADSEIKAVNNDEDKPAAMQETNEKEEEGDEEEQLSKTSLMAMKKAELIAMAKRYSVSETGTKKVLTESILEAYNNKQGGNAKRKRSDSSNGKSKRAKLS
jgi:U2 small nuclear ribonucleoprotein A'